MKPQINYIGVEMYSLIWVAFKQRFGHLKLLETQDPFGQREHQPGLICDADKWVKVSS